MKVLLVLSCAFSLANANLVGGWNTLDLEDKATKALANAAVQEFDATSNSLFRNKVVKVLEVKSQVVAGIKYSVEVEIAETECTKHDTRELTGCQVTRPSQICVIKYWVQPWSKTQQITSSSCHPADTDETPPPSSPAPPLVGGAEGIDPTTPEVQEAARFAVDAVNAQSNEMYRAQLLEVKECSKQTVAGVKFTMTLELGFSLCRNSEENISADLTKCPLDNHRRTEECTIEVLDQKWADPRFTLLNHQCLINSKDNSIDDSLTFPIKDKPLLGGGDHDVGNYGTFTEFKQKFNRNYATKEEEVKRFHIFRYNMKKARKIQDSDKGTATYGATKFADMTKEEFKQYLGLRPDLASTESAPMATVPTETPPTAFDWREHNAVTPVKNQGSCGSCWAFSTTGNIEGQWAIRKSKLVSLSEQELVDCDKVDQGCNGGLPSNAYKVIQKLGGLETEAEYPYEGRDDKCEFDRQDVRVYINGSETLSSNEKDMAAWLYKNGPISIGINAMAMQFYMGGVSHPWSFLCSPEDLDHGVLIVGYGIHDGWLGKTPYWIVKNSWGPDWGEKGYYLVYRGAGVCGLNKMPTSAKVN